MTPRAPAAKIVSPEGAAAWAGAQRARGGCVVVARGVFDLLEVAHVRGLQAARARGDALVVLVRDDAGAASVAGAGGPVVPAADRSALIASLRCVDRVVVLGGTPEDVVLRALRPDIDVRDEDAGASGEPDRPARTVYDRVRALHGVADER